MGYNTTDLLLHRSMKDPRRVRAYIERGASVHARTRNRWTPLHRAVQAGCADSIAVLLAAGADTTAVNITRETPYDMAVRLGHATEAELLLSWERSQRRRTVALNATGQSACSADTPSL